MATVRPFRALRPSGKAVEEVISLPYDVMNRKEAKEMAKDSPNSFLHITRAEIDLDDSIPAYDDRVYKQGRDNLEAFIDKGVLVRDSDPAFYIYRQRMNGNTQTGLVACVAVAEYENNTIKKHELTRVEKEEDRIRHFDVCNANTEPIFLTYRGEKRIDTLLEGWISDHEPEYDFTTEDGISHELWMLDDAELIEATGKLFSEVTSFYIADGHHRSASAYKVGKRKQSEESKYFMAVLFPDHDLKVFDYNRVVKDLFGHSKEEFISLVERKFILNEAAEIPYRPKKKHEFGMYLDGKWYTLQVRPGFVNEDDVVGSLDVALLQELLLGPILGIGDPRKDNRIDFVGGIRGLSELEKRVNEDMEVAFCVHPVTVDELIAVSDKGEIMPPKSTWFEPKLGSGLFVHEL